MTKASDNPYPSLLIVEGTTPANPSAGDQRLFIDSADHLLKLVDSSGTVTEVGSGGATSPLTTKGDVWGYDTGDARIPVGTNGQVLTADSTQALGLKWAAPTGGAPTLAFVGYNTVGGSTEALVSNRTYMKKVSLTAGQVVMSVEGHFQISSDVTDAFIPAIWTDNAGAPQYLRQYGGPGSQSALLAEGTGGPRAARWIGGALNFYVESTADYWIGMFGAQGGGVIYYDGSGSDRVFTASIAGTADYGRFTPTTTSNKYSIRALVMG